MSLTITIAGNQVVFDEDSFKISQKLDERWRCQFTVLDYAGTQQYSYRQQVVVTDSALGTLYAGFIVDVKQDKSKMYPSPGIEHQIDCIDMRALVDKRTSNWFYANQQAGVIAVHQVQKYLAAEGVTAAAALRWDEQLTDWQAGTLTNAIATTNAYDSNPGDGDLELALAGVSVTKTESTTADWNAGTLTGLQAVSNQLLLNSHSGISFSASCANNFGNAFAYYRIWSGSYTIKSGDFLGYKVWINSSSPQIMAGVDGVCSDGTSIRDFNSNALVDQNGIIAHPKADLSGFANDQWYYRKIDISALAGKTLSFATVAFEGDNGGSYQAYFYDVQIEDVNGVLQQNLYGDGGVFHSNAVTLNTLNKISSNGYSNVMVKTLLVYESTGTRISPAVSVTAAGIYKSSQISWAQTLPANTTLTMYTSIDGSATWQAATSLSAIANLLPGASLTGRTITTKQVLSLTGKDPTTSPTLTGITWTVAPSYVATKSDTKTTYDTQADWNAGTLTNLTATAGGDLTITSYQKNWDDASTANQTLFGAASPAMGTLKRQASLTTGNLADAKARLDAAGTWTDFTMSIDVQITSAQIWSGLVYRTTGWINARDTFAYKADINLSGVFLDRATNGGASSPTTIASATLSLNVGDWHTLTVVVSGSSHKVYVDGVLYINVVDATYGAAGNVGIILNNSSGGTTTGYFDNFGIMATPGIVGGSPAPQWLSASISLGSITVGNSIVFWDTDSPNGAIISVLASVNGGAFNACTNGSVIPGLTAGTVLTGGTVQFKVQLQSPTAAVTPMFHGLTSWVLSSFSSSGSRISPLLSLAAVGRVGTSLVNWNALQPTNTSVAVDTSIDNQVSWQNVASPGGAISGITVQPAPFVDSFNLNWLTAVMNSNPTAYYKLNETSGPVANDSSGHGNNATLSGSITYSQPSLLADTTDTALGFGAAASLALPYTMNITTWTAFSMMFWIQVSSSVDFVAITCDGSTVIVYINGVPTTTSNDPIVVSSILEFAGSYAAGTMDEVVIYQNVVLTVAQISNFYQSGTFPGVYTSTFGSGGSASTWTYDLTNSRITASGGATGLYLYNNITAADVDVMVDMDQSDFGGICFRHVDATHYYVLAIRDASSPVAAAPNSVQLYKANGGAESAIGPSNVPIKFVRGIPHRFRVTMMGGVITVYMDGTQLLTYTDPSPLGAGQCGLRNDTFSGASTSRYYSLRIQPLGDDVTSKTLYTRVRLTSTDPTATPAVLDMQAFVSSPAIGAGTLIPSADYTYTFVDKNLDDLSKQSNYGWLVDVNKALNFQGRQAVPAPWLLTSNTLAQPSDLEVDNNLLAEVANDLYRNRQVLKGVIGTGTFSDTFVGDGKTTSFTLRYPIAPGTVPTVILNGQAQTVALQGASGAQWYYAVGSTTLAQDSSGTVLTSLDTLSAPSYTGTFSTDVVVDNLVAQAALKDIEGGSGIVEAVEDVSQRAMTYAAGVVYANQLLARYCVTDSQGRPAGRTLTYKTYRNGLAVGQIQGVFIPEEFLQDVQLLIRQIDIGMQTQPNNTVLYNYVVQATELPNTKSWQVLLASTLLD